MIRSNKELFTYVSEHKNLNTNPFFTKENVTPGQKLIEQNKSDFYVYIIKKGIAKCYLTQDTGEDFIQEFFGKGEVFGEIEAINHATSFCTIEAITEMIVYKISKIDFIKLVERDPEFNIILIRSMAHKIKYKALRHAYNQSHSIASNLTRLQKQFPELTTYISKQDIANYLGITLRSLNRVLKDMT